jgi:hypothetical protein
VIDFDSKRSELDFDGLRVFLDGDAGYIGIGRDGWERAQDADQFLALGGPLWLIDLLDRVVTAEGIGADDGQHVTRPGLDRGLHGDTMASGRRFIATARQNDDDDEPTSLALTITVDADGRIARVGHESEMVGGSVSIELYDYGRPQALDSPAG